MGFAKWSVAPAVMVTVFLAAPAAHAQVATFSDITDAVPSRFYDSATSAPDFLDANKLILGFGTGRDPSNWRMNDFRASTAAFSHTTAMDTISFNIEAPAGFYVSRITYAQSGTGSAVRTGKASGGATWVVGGRAADLGIFGTNPTLESTMDLTGLNLTVVPVSVTNALFAYATPSLGSASVAITSAEVRVELLPLVQ